MVQVGNQECGVEAGAVIWLGDKQYDVRAGRHSVDSAVIEESVIWEPRGVRGADSLAVSVGFGGLPEGTHGIITQEAER